MKLHKRNCDIRIRPTPCGADFQKVQWSIGGDRHVLWPSAVMGGQFSDLVTAVYCLYSEGDDDWGFDGYDVTTVSYKNGSLAVQDMLNGNINYVIIDAAPAACIVESLNKNA